METTSNFTQAQLIEKIWAEKAICKKHSIKKTPLNDMTVDELLALAETLQINLEETPATATVELSANGITPRTTLNGTIVYTMDLQLVHSDGYAFHFAFGDKKVVIAGDLQLSDCYEKGLLSINDMVPFHYHGVDSWKPLSVGSDYLVPNNSGERAREHSSSGTIAKSFFAPIANLLAEDKLASLKRNLEMQKIAKETGLKIRQLRTIDREDRVQDAREMLKALRK